MLVLKVEPGKKAVAKEIENELEALQKEVGGYIERIYPFEEDSVAILANEEGILLNLQLNRTIRNNDGTIINAIVGTFLVVGVGEDDFVSLSDDLLQKYLKYYETPEFFGIHNGKIVVFGGSH